MVESPKRPVKWRRLTIPSDEKLDQHEHILRTQHLKPDPDGCFLCWCVASREPQAPTEETR